MNNPEIIHDFQDADGTIRKYTWKEYQLHVKQKIIEHCKFEELPKYIFDPDEELRYFAIERIKSGL